MPIPESKYKNQITACVGLECPMRTKCKLWYNLNENNIWVKIRAPYDKGAMDCHKFKPM